MDLELLRRSLLVGLAIAAPVGPIGLLCIRRTLADGWLAGFSTGLGAATADAIYGGIATLGLTVVIDWLGTWEPLIRLTGGLALIAIGVRTTAAPLPARTTRSSSRTAFGAYGTTVALTLANPATIVSFLGIVASLKLNGPPLPTTATVMVGIAGGSASWWLMLSLTVVALRSRMTPFALTLINRIAGALLAAFGVWVAAPVLVALLM